MVGKSLGVRGSGGDPGSVGVEGHGGSGGNGVFGQGMNGVVGLLAAAVRNPTAESPTRQAFTVLAMGGKRPVSEVKR